MSFTVEDGIAWSIFGISGVANALPQYSDHKYVENQSMSKKMKRFYLLEATKLKMGYSFGI